MVAPTFIVTVGVSRIARRISDLITAAREIAGRSFDRRIDVRAGDELEQLGDQFNAMTGQLQASYADLERTVEDRTKELATLNAIAAEVSQALDLQEILDNAFNKVLDTMGMEYGQAFRLDEEAQILVRMGPYTELTQHNNPKVDVFRILAIASKTLISDVAAVQVQRWQQYAPGTLFCQSEDSTRERATAQKAVKPSPCTAEEAAMEMPVHRSLG